MAIVRELWCKGILIPKTILAHIGLDDQAIADITVENEVILLRKPATSVRFGWSEAAKAINAFDADVLMLGEFPNSQDQDLV